MHGCLWFFLSTQHTCVYIGVYSQEVLKIKTIAILKIFCSAEANEPTVNCKKIFIEMFFWVFFVLLSPICDTLVGSYVLK